ncbi:hypothetical protein [Myroides pelagicus]|uniref:Uncharacterized protein n=1 Tax=Myroides pelagicus TaxID=270914 RepID=A0A7K1GHC4_9FLAO|nr:hypothetical protein [Myroides pelagicus]MEC4113509.1 hypothetical protein [Myroides pelagicus]MTH28346.1 hypothetical protein [Myroides pelagicus]
MAQNALYPCFYYKIDGQVVEFSHNMRGDKTVKQVIDIFIKKASVLSRKELTLDKDTLSRDYSLVNQ